MMITEKKSIIVIEDEPMQIRILNRILSPQYDIKPATTGEKGLKLANKHPIDLILLDIILEDMSGFEVLAALQASEKNKNTPVIFITSMDTREDEIKGLSAGAVDYITKPFIEEIVRLRVGLHMQLISQLRTIEKLSLYDGLTEIQNRRSFNLIIKDLWGHMAEKCQCFSMIMLDVDKFKQFNDTYGHLCGDECLKTVAAALKSVLRKNDSIFRWGGEEFVVLLPETPLDTAVVLAERLRQAVAKAPIEYDGSIITTVTISLGVGCIYPNEEDKPERFCAEVDGALYQAKNNGRNRVEVV